MKPLNNALKVVNKFKYHPTINMLKSSKNIQTRCFHLKQFYTMKSQKKSKTYHPDHNILELYNVLVQVWFATSYQKLKFGNNSEKTRLAIAVKNTHK